MLACALSSKAENRIGHCHYNPPLNAENARLFLCCHFSKLLLGIPFRLVEEANDLAGDVLATGLLVIHNTGGGGQDDVAELTGREQLDNPLLEVGEADVVPGGDDTRLVEAAVELDDDLAGAVVIDLLELANVA